MDDQEANVPLQPDADAGGQEEQSFTIDPVQVEQGLKDQMEPADISDLNRVLKEGNKLLFDKESHYQIMDGIESSKDLPGDLGMGAFNVLMMLFKGGKYSMPTQLLQPAGTILLTRACAYIAESGIAPITDDDYEEAMHIFTTQLQNLNPKFKERMAQSLGGGQSPAPDAAAQPQPQVGGMLNQGVQ